MRVGTMFLDRNLESYIVVGDRRSEAVAEQHPALENEKTAPLHQNFFRPGV